MESQDQFQKFGEGVFRFCWDAFPDVSIHAEEKEVRSHPDYMAAKTGDSDAAFRLVHDFLSENALAHIAGFADGRNLTLTSAHALERHGVNAIPEALAEVISERIGLPIEHEIVQTNIVSHTRADGFARLARQAKFGGHCSPGNRYFLVDDFIGQGGTLANLRGWIMQNDGHVVGASVLTGKHYSAKLSPDLFQINELKTKHGEELRRWWLARFGFDYDCLTSSEARYLINTPCPQRIRDRITAAIQA